MVRFVLAVALALCASIAAAEDIGLVAKGVQRGQEYRFSVNADGTVTIRPLQVVTVGGGPSDPDPTNPVPDLALFTTEIQNLTAAALTKGGTKTTGAGLSSVYSLVADSVAKGETAPADVLKRLNSLTSAIMAMQADEPHWKDWRAKVGDALNTLVSQGELQTRDQWENVLRAVAAGAAKATGFAGKPAELAKLNPAGLAQLDAADGNEDGILDGINIEQIIKLIELIMRLLEMFKN